MSDLRGTAVTWLGHSVVHIQTPGGTSILVDPFITGNPEFPKGYKMPDTIDLLLITHGHADHFSDAIPVAKKYRPKVLGMFELTQYMAQKGTENTNGMNFGGSFRHKDVTVSMVEAKHSSSIQDGDKFLYAGNPAGFVLQIENGPTLYHAGDTSVFSDMQLIREFYAPEFGMLPIGDNFTMGPKHAAIAARYLGLKAVLPIHYGTFPALTGTPDALEKALEGTGIETVHVKAGETLR